MNETEILEWIREVTAEYPRFDDGRINYSETPLGLGVNAAVVHGDAILLTQRSGEVGIYPHFWSGISGFVDEIKPLSHIVLKELHEEVGIPRQQVARLEVRPKLVFPDEHYNKEWHIFPALVELTTSDYGELNWENKTVRWVPLGEVENFKLMPGFRHVLRAALEARN